MPRRARFPKHSACTMEALVSSGTRADANEDSSSEPDDSPTDDVSSWLCPEGTRGRYAVVVFHASVQDACLSSIDWELPARIRRPYVYLHSLGSKTAVFVQISDRAERCPRGFLGAVRFAALSVPICRVELYHGRPTDTLSSPAFIYRAQYCGNLCLARTVRRETTTPSYVNPAKIFPAQGLPSPPSSPLTFCQD